MPSVKYTMRGKKGAFSPEVTKTVLRLMKRVWSLTASFFGIALRIQLTQHSGMLVFHDT